MGHHLEKKYPVVYIGQAQALRHHHTKANKPSKIFLNMFITPNRSGWTDTEKKHKIKEKTHKPTQVSLVFLSAGDAVKRCTVSFFSPVFSSSDVGVIVVLLGVVFLSLSPSLFPNLSFPSEPILCRSQRTPSPPSSSYLVTCFISVYTQPVLSPGLSLFILS